MALYLMSGCALLGAPLCFMLMNFLHLTIWYWFLAALAAGICLCAIAAGRRRRQRILRQLAGERLGERLTLSVDWPRRRLRDLLFLAGIALVLLAAARPWWGQRPVPTPARSRDIMLVMDCSQSMLAADVAPSRLLHAKWLVRELVRQFPGDRFGLVAFAGDAFLECPLTSDRNTLLIFLDDLDTGTIPVGGTNIATALKVVQDALHGGAEGQDRAVLLISDGDELQGNARSQIEKLREQNITLITIGVGNPGEAAMIQLADNTYLRDSQGNLVDARLNETLLREVAAAAEGVYFRSTAMQPNLDGIVAQLDDLIPQEREEKVSMRPVERYQLPLATGLFLLIIRLFIGDRKSRRALANAATATGLAVLVLWSAPATGQSTTPVAAAASPDVPTATPAADAAAADAADDATAAAPAQAALAAKIARTEENLEKTSGPDASRLHYNLGTYHQQSGNPEKAIASYQAALENTDAHPVIKTLALWNLGVCSHLQANVNFRQQQYDKSLTALENAIRYYREALQRQPGTKELAGNLELAIQERREVQFLKELQEKLMKQLAEARQAVNAARGQQEQVNAAAAAAAPETPTAAAPSQEEAEQTTRQAREKVRELQEFIHRQQLQLPQNDQIKQAEEALTQALNEQNKARQQVRTDPARMAARNEALRQLQMAANALGAEEAKPDQQSDDDGNDQKQDGSESDKPAGDQNQASPGNADDDQADPKNGDDLDRQLQEQPPTPEQNARAIPAADDEQTYDKAQAQALLKKMQEQEQDLRDALKQHRARQFRYQENEKNW